MNAPNKTRGKMDERKNLYFKVWADWKEKIEPLDLESRGELFTALVEYINGGEIIPLSTNAKYLFPTLKSLVDFEVEKVESAAAAHREAGRKGGRPKKAVQENIEKPNGSSRNQKVLSENQMKAEQEQEQEQEQSISPPIPPSQGGGDGQRAISALIDDAQLSDTVKAKLREWLAYKGKSAYKLAGAKALISRVCKAVETHGDAAVCGIIDDSMASGYKGIVWDRLDRARPQTPVRDSGFSTFDTEEFFNLAVKRGERMGTG